MNSIERVLCDIGNAPDDVEDVKNTVIGSPLKPLKNQASEGRANPKGIPYLYLSTTIDGAIAEVRPWIGSHVTVGFFKTARELGLIQCVCEYKSSDLHIYPLEEPDAETRTKAVWLDIDQAFSHPVTPSDQIADYVPTQILAELFRSRDFDGIAYRTSCGRGFNIVLFDLNAAEFEGAKLFEVTGVKVETADTGERYSMSDMKPDPAAKARLAARKIRPVPVKESVRRGKRAR